MTNQNIGSSKPDKTLDVIGFFCPEPIFRTRMEIDSMNKGEILEVLADDPSAEADISSWARKTGQEIISIEKKDESLRFLIKKTQ